MAISSLAELNLDQLILEMENYKALIFICCVLLIALIAGGETLLPQHKERNCTYAITIGTTCTKGADTSSQIRLRFGDAKSNDILVRHLNSKHVGTLDPLHPAVLDDGVPTTKPFQPCTVDQFQVTGQCVGSPICYLYLKLEGKDDWRPGFAQVRALEYGSSSSRLSSSFFYFRRYLPRHVWHGFDECDKEITPFGIKHRRKIFAEKDRN